MRQYSVNDHPYNASQFTIRVNYIYSAIFNFMFANCLKIKNLNSIFLFFSFLIKTILINFIFLIMIIGLIDNHSPALTPQEMSDFDQMDSIGEYSGDEVSLTPPSSRSAHVSPSLHPQSTLVSPLFHPRLPLLNSRLPSFHLFLTFSTAAYFILYLDN